MWLQVSEFKINLRGMGIGGAWIAPEAYTLYGDYLYQVISQLQLILLSNSTEDPCLIQLGKINAQDRSKLHILEDEVRSLLAKGATNRAYKVHALE